MTKPGELHHTSGIRPVLMATASLVCAVATLSTFKYRRPISYIGLRWAGS